MSMAAVYRILQILLPAGSSPSLTELQQHKQNQETCISLGYGIMVGSIVYCGSQKYHVLQICSQGMDSFDITSLCGVSGIMFALV